MNIQTIQNVNDCVPLYLPHSLYLKPVAKINVSVQLPQAITGKTISNWDVMEKLRSVVAPDTFSVLRVSKSTIEFIRLEAEIDERSRLRGLLSRLDGASIKLSGFSESVKVRASETKDEFPTRHDWDSFFRDAHNMDEMKAGERPDTIYISNLPINWFCPRHQENMENAKPSENIFKRIFEKFGEVKFVDIPICDPYRNQMKPHVTGLKSFAFDNPTFFEGYVQFSEYLGFVKTMDEFRGMKLVRKDGDKNLAVNIVVEFDKTKHLSESAMKRRKILRDRLVAKEKAKEEEERKQKEQEDLKKKKELEKQEELKRKELEKQKAREEKRKEKQLKKLQLKEKVEFDAKIREEEKKLLIAQRKLESIRLLEALFERIKVKSNISTSHVKVEGTKSKNSIKKSENKVEPISEKDLRNKLINKYKNAQEQEFAKRKEKLQKVRDGKGILSDLLVGGKTRSPSIDTISSNDSIFSDKGSTTKKAKKKKKKKKRSSSSSSSSSSIAEKSEKKSEEPPQNPTGMFPQPGFPTMFNPETGEWVSVYPYAAPFFPGAIRPNFYQPGYNPNYRGGPRGGGRFFRGRGRGFYRGRGGGGYNDDYHRYSNRNGGFEDDDGYRHHRRSRPRSRSRSRSRSDRRSRRRSRSSSRSRSRSRSRSHRKTSSSKKLASTLRTSKSPSSSSGWSSRSRSRSRYRSKRRSWSRRSSSRSRTRSRSRAKSEKRGEVKNDTKSQEKSPPRDEKSKSKSRERTPEQRSNRKRSHSGESPKFLSPKRKEKSQTPDWSK